MGWMNGLKNLLLNLPALVSLGQALVASVKWVKDYPTRRPVEKPEEKK